MLILLNDIITVHQMNVCHLWCKCIKKSFYQSKGQWHFHLHFDQFQFTVYSLNFPIELWELLFRVTFFFTCKRRWKFFFPLEIRSVKINIEFCRKKQFSLVCFPLKITEKCSGKWNFFLLANEEGQQPENILQSIQAQKSLLSSQPTKPKQNENLNE